MSGYWRPAWHRGLTVSSPSSTCFLTVPGPLAVSPDGGTKVYAAAFMSGNQTTSLSAGVVEGAKPLPEENHQGELPLKPGWIVRKDNNRWLDGDGTDWTANVMLDLPDYDVFLIDASSEIPNLFATVSGVGTTLFNMAVNLSPAPFMSVVWKP